MRCRITDRERATQPEVQRTALSAAHRLVLRITRHPQPGLAWLRLAVAEHLRDQLVVGDVPTAHLRLQVGVQRGEPGLYRQPEMLGLPQRPRCFPHPRRYLIRSELRRVGRETDRPLFAISEDPKPFSHLPSEK